MFHEQRECILCHRIDTIYKKPSFTINKQVKSEKQKPGRIVDDFIADAKKELKNQKKNLSRRTCNDRNFISV